MSDSPKVGDGPQGLFGASFAGRWLDRLEALGEAPLPASIRQGLVQVLPLILLGALALLLLNIPECPASAALDAAFGPPWRKACDFIQQGTFGIASLAVLVSASVSYARQAAPGRGGVEASPGTTAAVALACYFILAAPLKGPVEAGFFALGGGGFPVGVLVALTAPPLFLGLASRAWVSGRFLDGAGYDPTLQQTISTTPAAVLTLLAFCAARLALAAGGAPDPAGFAQDLFSLPFRDARPGLGLGLGYVLLSQVLWFLGLHGPNLLGLAERSILAPATLDNIGAAAMGLTPPHILTKPFVDAFVHIGGSGCTLSLLLAILLRSRDPSTRKLAFIALAPALFNVNEVVLFGLPLVLNPVYLVPFLLAPVASFLLAYAATALDLVPRTLESMHWTAPVLLGGQAATGSLAGALLQAANLVLGLAIYAPFVRLAGWRRRRLFSRSLGVLMRAAESSATGPRGRKCTDLPGAEGVLARNLASDLARELETGERLYLVYQPVMDLTLGICSGGEALLRWDHPVYGAIPPPVIVALAEDTGSIHALGLLVLRRACRLRAGCRAFMDPEQPLSVNVSPLQFEADGVVDMVRECLAESGITARMLKMEITESVALAPDARTVKILRELEALGVRMAIDDFGMGHTSLRYLKAFPVDTVKIDRSLTQADPGQVNEKILKSIVGLCASLKVQIVVEGVETREQVERFRVLGCTLFQGYFFSRPLSAGDFSAYVRAHGTCADPEAGFEGMVPESA